MPVEAIVYACCYAPEVGKQARKVLVLYDQEGSYFFLSTWPAWQRVSKAAEIKQLEMQVAQLEDVRSQVPGSSPGDTHDAT